MERSKLIDAILELATDECDDVKEMTQLAKESEEQLIERIISIAQWYKEQY